MVSGQERAYRWEKKCIILGMTDAPTMAALLQNAPIVSSATTDAFHG